MDTFVFLTGFWKSVPRAIVPSVLGCNAQMSQSVALDFDLHLR